MSQEQNEVMEFDVLIVGAGPAGLSAAIRLKQLAVEHEQEISVCVVEKGSEVGAHSLAGAVLETRALDELMPDWKDKGAPLVQEAKEDHFWLLGHKGKCINMPLPPQMKNHGNYIISLGQLNRWLAEQAQELGVEIFPGFPAKEIAYKEDENRIIGIVTGAFGLDKEGNEKPGYQPGIEIRAKLTLIAEGARGHLSQRVEDLFGLRDGKSDQTFGLGFKELWEVPEENFEPGKVIHTIGWPLSVNEYGGGFIYHGENRQIQIGFVIGLDYANPHVNPYKEFQKFKSHPKVRAILEGGKRTAYGARALTEGGLQSAMNPSFPGGAVLGCAVGYMNVPKIKGIHTSMKSGMIAAESAMDALREGRADMFDYGERIKASWIHKELHKVRNIRPGFRFGLFGGLLNAALTTYITRGYEPWTMKHKADHLHLKPAKSSPKIDYPEPDGEVSFDILSSVYLSNTNHEEDQPCHLLLVEPERHSTVNIDIFDAPETRYCPAGVYELVDDTSVEVEDGEAVAKKLQINAQNCLHCKTCDIKDPTLNIVWSPPEGGGGPNYTTM